MNLAGHGGEVSSSPASIYSRREVSKMAHLTMFRFRALPGKHQAVVDQFARWEREHKAKATGFEQSILVASNKDRDEFIGAVRWDSTENYTKNSNRPEQDDWFRELRSNLVGDPEWFDGTVERESTT
jgi:heme-degrading monooxygenase HmoA